MDRYVVSYGAKPNLADESSPDQERFLDQLQRECRADANAQILKMVNTFVEKTRSHVTRAFGIE